MLLWYPYLLIAFPFTLLTSLSVIDDPYYSNPYYGHINEYYLAWICLFLSFIPLYFHFKRINRRLKTQKKIVEYIMKETGFTLARGNKIVVFAVIFQSGSELTISMETSCLYRCSPAALLTFWDLVQGI